MAEIEQQYVGWVTMGGYSIIFPCDEIVSTEQKVYKTTGELDGSYIVRLVKHTPTIEFVCESKQAADELVDFLNKSKKVRNISEYKNKKGDRQND